MKLLRACALLTAVLFATPLAAASQDDVRRQEVERIRAVVQSLGPKPTKVALLTRQLIVTRGRIVRSRETSFDLKHNGGVTTIFYANVLELTSKKGSVSLVPDRDMANQGYWDDVGRIYPATRILLVYSNGSAVKGFSHSTSRTHLIMIDKNGRNRVDVPKDDVLAVYGLIGGYGGVKSGASRGAEGITSGRNVLLHGLFAGVGALVGIVKSDGRPVLIYSK